MDSDLKELSMAERIAINIYTRDDIYIEMNALLREDYTYVEHLTMTLFHIAFAASGLNACRAKPLQFSGCFRYEGLFNQAVLQQRIKAAQSGQVSQCVTQERAFSSCSETSQNYFLEKVAITYEGAIGKSIHSISENTDEKEILFPPTQVRWKSYKKIDDMHYFQAVPVRVLDGLSKEQRTGADRSAIISSEIRKLKRYRRYIERFYKANPAIYKINRIKFDRLTFQEWVNSERGLMNSWRHLMKMSYRINSSHFCKIRGQISAVALEKMEELHPLIAYQKIHVPLTNYHTIDQFKKVGLALGSNLGGQYECQKTERKYYIKLQDGSSQFSREKIKNELLANKLYALAGTPVIPLEKVDLKNGHVGLASVWKNNLKSINGEASDKEKIDSLYSDLLIDCWLNNWDFVGADFDNLLLQVKDGQAQAIRIDMGGALNFRAMENSTKTASYGPQAFDSTVRMLRTLFEKNPNATKIFGQVRLGHLRQGCKKLKAIRDGDLYDQVIKLGPDTLDAKLDLFLKLMERKEHLIQYLEFLRGKVSDDVNVKDIVSSSQYGIQCFKLTHRYNPDLTKESPMDEISWDIVKNHYLKSRDDSFKVLYQKCGNCAIPEFPIKRIKHGAMHVIRAALAVKIFVELYRQAENKEALKLAPEEIKMLQIALLFHDSQRESDVGADRHEWELHAEVVCREYLLKLGFDEVKAKWIASSIPYKDSFGQKNIYQIIIHDADSLEVLRSHFWNFSQKYLDYWNMYQNDPNSILLLDVMIMSYRKALEAMGDAPQSFQYVTCEGNSLRFKPHYSLQEKRKFEHNPRQYAMIEEIMKNHMKIMSFFLLI